MNLLRSMSEALEEKHIFEHLLELRKRLIVSLLAALAASVVCFIFYDRILSFLFSPFSKIKAGEQLLQEGKVLFVNTIFEGFLIKLKIALLSGFILSAPVHLFNIVRFVFPGLTPKEKKVIVISLAASFVLVVSSFFYSYYKVIPISIQFLTGSGFIPKNTGLLLNFGRNIFYIFQFLIISIILFQLPILLEILMIMNVVRRKSLLKISRFVIVGVFVLAAVVTPPDFISQLSLAIPLVLLYFLTILIAKIFRFGEG